MSLGYTVQEAFRSFFRAKRLNLIAMATMSLSLMALGLVLALNAGVWLLTQQIEEKIEIVLFLDNQTTVADADRLTKQLKDHPQVISVEYVSREEAVEIFSRDQALRGFIDMLGENPLPASMRIGLADKTPENIARFVTWIKQFPGIEDMSYGGEDADHLLKALELVRGIVYVLTAALLFATIIVIANVISLIVHTRQEEISLLRMLGATNGFIRGPFLIWGLIQGVAGGLLATGLLYGLWLVLHAYALNGLGVDLLGYLPPMAKEWFGIGAAGLMITGCFLGLTGTLISVGQRLET